MSRKNPIPDSELAINRRLLEYRLYLRLSRVAFADEVNLDSSVITRIEHNRVPVKCSVIWKINWRFPLNIGWLVTGEGPRSVSFTLPNMEKIGVVPNELLSAVYPNKIKPFVDDILKQNSSPSDGVSTFPPTSDGRFKAYLFLNEQLKTWLCIVGDDELNSFVAELDKCGWDFARIFKSGHEGLVGRRYAEMDKIYDELESRGEFTNFSDLGVGRLHLKNNPEKNLLTNDSLKGNVSPVKSVLANLIKRLNKAASGAGKKAALAAYVGVEMPRVWEWLNNKKEPGGEYTLRLLEWVTAEESNQQKSPGGALTPPEPKTRSKPSKHEKPKSSPP